MLESSPKEAKIPESIRKSEGYILVALDNRLELEAFEVRGFGPISVFSFLMGAKEAYNIK